MFCPNCGRDNLQGIKYCASCGTNLEAVSLVLSGKESDFLTRFDTGIDQFISRYTEHFFEQKRGGPPDQSVVRSWQLLGQAIVTSFIDLLLFILMWNILPIRFMILLITSPFRLLFEKSREAQALPDGPESYESPRLVDPARRTLIDEAVPSVTEETTANLSLQKEREKGKTPITDKLEDRVK